MKALFLDIDGVLTGRDAKLVPEKVKLLNELKGVDIVISSSWGLDGGRTEKCLKEAGLELPVIGATEHCYRDWICRGNEIEKWLNDNMNVCTKFGHESHDYAIIDDECDILYGQKDNFVQTDSETGLEPEHIEKLKKILKLDEEQSIILMMES